MAGRTSPTPGFGVALAGRTNPKPHRKLWLAGWGRGPVPSDLNKPSSPAAMRILFLCHRFPYPPNEGGKIRSFNMIRHLSRNHAVVVASLTRSEAERQAIAGLERYCTAVVSAPIGPAATAAALLGLLADLQERRRLALAGRARMESHHSWAGAMAKLDRIIAQTMANHGADSVGADADGG